MFCHLDLPTDCIEALEEEIQDQLLENRTPTAVTTILRLLLGQNPSAETTKRLLAAIPTHFLESSSFRFAELETLVAPVFESRGTKAPGKSVLHLMEHMAPFQPDWLGLLSCALLISINKSDLCDTQPEYFSQICNRVLQFAREDEGLLEGCFGSLHKLRYEEEFISYVLSRKNSDSSQHMKRHLVESCLSLPPF